MAATPLLGPVPTARVGPAWIIVAFVGGAGPAVVILAMALQLGAPPDWLLGLLSGALATAFGVALSMCWDLWKERRATKGRNRALQEIVEVDLATNLTRVGSNVRNLKNELALLTKHMMLVEPLPLLRTGFWEILRTEPTSKFLTVKEKGKLHELYDSTELVNERLRARELFKNHNANMTNFNSTMQIHDEELIKALGKLNDALAASGAKGTPPTPGA